MIDARFARKHADVGSNLSAATHQSLTNEIAREAVISSLAYANLAVFVAVLFCFGGLSAVAAIQYVAVAYAGFALTAIIGGLYLRLNRPKRLRVAVVASVAANDLILSSILLFDYSAITRANTLTGVVTIVSISFISVHLCARFSRPMFVSKIFIIGACCFYVVVNPSTAIPITQAIASLIVALLIMLATGYWIILRRRAEVGLQLRLQELNKLTDNQNNSLKIALDEKEQTQIQLAQEYSLRQKLVSHIGHDLRQPISAASYMLMELKKQELSDSELSLISDTTECINSASRMIEDIVQFTHFDNLEIEVQAEWVDIDAVIKQIAREFYVPAKDAECEIRCARTSLRAFIDPDLLRRVLRNLTTNVIKHSDATKMLLGVRRRNSGLEIWIVDNGRGLNGQDSQLTTAPPTSSNAGLGLGIKISHRLAAACGASLSYTSFSGEGTVFKLAIPAHFVKARLQNR